jgi:hypothetical protein
MRVAAGVHGGQQGAQFFFGDPRRQDLPTAVFADDGVPHGGKVLVQQSFSGSQ